MTISTRVQFTPRGLLALEPTAYGATYEPVSHVAPAAGPIPVIGIRGPLMQHADDCFDSYEAILARAAAAFEGKPRAVVLAISSPGGLVSGCFEAAEMLRAMAAKAGVQLIAYVDGQACSAAYALACAASQIVAPATADVGSIGVIAVLADATAQAEAMGMRFAVIASGKRKADGNPMTALTADAIATKQAHVDETAGMFFQHVAAARGMSPEAVRALEAGTFTGATALRLHLVDAVQNLDQLLASLNQPASATQAAAAEKPKMSVKKALQAVVDDDKASDEDKEDAKKALAALDDGEDDKAADDDEKPADDKASDEDKEDDKASDEDKEDDKAVAASATTALSPVEARLAALEATVTKGTDNAKRSKLFASRPDLSKDQIKALKAVPTAALAASLAAIPKPKAGLTAAAVAAAQAGTAPAVPAPAFDAKRAAQRKRMGLSASTAEPAPIRIENDKFVFSVAALAQSKSGKVVA